MTDNPPKRRMRRSKLRSWIDESVPEPRKPGRKPNAKANAKTSVKTNAAPAQRRQTMYDVDHMPLHCLNCGRIYNGPHFGEVVETGGPEYRAIDAEQRKLRGDESIGAISDTVSCNKRSCIDTYAKMHYDEMRHKYQDRDWTADEREFREAQYKFVRDKPEQFPEGLIDDVEPPL